LSLPSRRCWPCLTIMSISQKIWKLFNSSFAFMFIVLKGRYFIIADNPYIILTKVMPLFQWRYLKLFMSNYIYMFPINIWHAYMTEILLGKGVKWNKQTKIYGTISERQIFLKLIIMSLITLTNLVLMLIPKKTLSK
jgi:hypothetical protein